MARSSAEILMQAQLEQAGIPFVSEFVFAAPRKWRADFMVAPTWETPIPPAILVEIDGGSWVAGRHTRGEGFERDLEKLNAAALLGYRVLRFTPAMVEDGRALAVIRQALGMEVAA